MRSHSSLSSIEQATSEVGYFSKCFFSYFFSEEELNNYTAVRESQFCIAGINRFVLLLFFLQRKEGEDENLMD